MQHRKGESQKSMLTNKASYFFRVLPYENTSCFLITSSVNHAEGSAEEYVSDAYLAAVGHLFSMLQADLHDDFLDTDFISTAYEDSATGNETEHADITNSSNEDCI